MYALPGVEEVRSISKTGLSVITAVFGNTVLNGVVMVHAIKQYLADGVGAREAVLEGAVSRLRPVLMTGFYNGARAYTPARCHRRRFGGAAAIGGRGGRGACVFDIPGPIRRAGHVWVFLAPH